MKIVNNKRFMKYSSIFILILFSIYYFFYKKYFIDSLNDQFGSSNDRRFAFPHNYRILAEPLNDVCNQNIIVVAGVTVAPDSFEKRSLIRKTWGNQSIYSNISVIFLIGTSPYDYINDMIINENKIYNDILQENFLDAVLNMTTKTRMAFKWFDENCKSVKFFLKIGDDVIVNTKYLVKYLSLLKDQNINKTWIGKWEPGHRFDRNPSHRFYIPLNFSEKHTKYCFGSAYIFTYDLIYLIYSKSLITFPPFTQDMEDVYIGYILLKFKIEFQLIQIRNKFIGDNDNKRSWRQELQKKEIQEKNDFLFVWANDAYYELLWNIIYLKEHNIKTTTKEFLVSTEKNQIPTKI